MNAFVVLRTLVQALCLSFVLLLHPMPSLAQVMNGSFEINSQPALDGWSFSCGGTSFQEAPPEGGAWSLKLAPGNLQGCFPGTAWQTVPAVQDGDVWRLTAWVKQDTATSTVARLYWRIGSASGASVDLPADTTTARSWTQLTVVDTLFLQAGDSAAVVLDAGRTSGPERIGSGYLFDRVSAEKLDRTPVNADDHPQPEQVPLNLSQNFPNPFDDQTTISFHLGRPGYVRLDIYDVPGRKVETVLAGHLPAGEHRATWHAAGLPCGRYFGRLQAGREVRVLMMTLLR